MWENEFLWYIILIYWNIIVQFECLLIVATHSSENHNRNSCRCYMLQDKSCKLLGWSSIDTSRFGPFHCKNIIGRLLQGIIFKCTWSYQSLLWPNANIMVIPSMGDYIWEREGHSLKIRGVVSESHENLGVRLIHFYKRFTLKIWGRLVRFFARSSNEVCYYGFPLFPLSNAQG